MGPRELHVMQVTLDDARRTMRYTCPLCDRCVEDGPDGLTILNKGDQDALHRGGNLMAVEMDIEPLDPPEAENSENPNGSNGPSGPNGKNDPKAPGPVLH